ncbi:Predicted Fe-S protein (modular protein) [Crenothrix polyspora]|uniref:Predicted Fe-S protein (Modular protein) n=1 Tax=Crenothrix polyspora TaxID=360316 RepID=A0A1R4H8S2_9GAMM|nr:DUF1289 domain-containing protein [Crenothrix polyspora]SJM92668.1 Predicted Fe-S protein (modular protein) [Crenothrix polyspora]
MIEPVPVASPCVGLCCLDNSDICVGCFRSLDEIKAWSQVDDKTRLVFIGNAKQRNEARKNNVTEDRFDETIA